MNTYGLAEAMGYSGSLARFMDENWQQAIELSNRVDQLRRDIPALNSTLFSPTLATIEQAQTMLSSLADYPDTHFWNWLEHITAKLEQISHPPVANNWEPVSEQEDTTPRLLEQLTPAVEAESGIVENDGKLIEVPMSAASALQSVEAFLPENQREKAAEIASSIQNGAFWTYDRIMALVSLFLSLLTIILGLLPNREDAKQTEIAEEQLKVEESRLEIEKERLELEKEMLDIASNIMQSVDELTDVLQSEYDNEERNGIQQAD